MKKVAIVLLNWNQSDYTIQCINSLEKIKYTSFSIYLIDNGSSAIELKKLEDFLHLSKLDIHFTKSAVNLGFTGGNNELLKQILQTSDISYALLLNNDTEVDPDFLTILVNEIENNNEIGTIGPLVLNAHDKTIIDSAGTKTIIPLAQGTLLGHGKHINSVDIQKNEVDYITGCALLVRFDVLKNVGLLDDTFFAYFEDIDYGVRVKNAGYKNLFEPKSIVYHYGSVSSVERSEFFYMLSCRNRLIFAKKHMNPLNFYLVFIPYFFMWKIGFKFLTSKSKSNFIKGHYKGLKNYLNKNKAF